MKNLYLLFAVVLFFVSGKAQVINFPDANFKAKLLASSTTNSIATTFLGVKIKIDANDNGEIEVSEITDVRKLTLNNSGISSLEGIINFASLYELNCSNNQLTNLNLNGLAFLDKVNCSFNQLTSLVYDSQAMLNINATDNQLTNLDISSSTLGYSDIMGIVELSNNPITNIYALNVLPYQCYIDFQTISSLTYICCATQNNIDRFQYIADLQSITTIVIDDSCLLHVETPNQKGSRLYPNPVSNVLTIDSDTNVVSYSIYNTLGQSVLEIPNAQNIKTIDVSSLKTGNYFLKITSDRGSSSVKFLKM
jgi:hypothetical protein